MDPSAIPVEVCALGETAPCTETLTALAAVSAGSFHALALTTEGSLVTWGDNDFGQLGTDTSGNTSTIPVAVSGY